MCVRELWSLLVPSDGDGSSFAGGYCCQNNESVELPLCLRVNATATSDQLRTGTERGNPTV